MKQSDKSKHLLSLIRSGEPMTLGQRLRLVVYLSVPAIIAQLSSIVMQYIDASMVGSLGAEASASIGLVSTTTWLFGGIVFSCVNRFYGASGTSDRSWRHARSTCRVASVVYSHSDMGIGRISVRYVDKHVFTLLVGRRCGYTA